MTGPWTCFHDCTKHQYRLLCNAVGHSCCGRCREGLSCMESAWGNAPMYPHGYEESILKPGLCLTCKQGPH